MKIPTIEDLAAMTREELSDVLGLTAQLVEAEKEIGKLDKLTGKAREYAEGRVEDMLSPNVYPNEFSYIRERAEEAGNPKKALDSESPESIM